jgi:kinesin family protein 6/9
MHFVDLAGSERVSKTLSTGETLMEAKHINKSLSFLEQVVLSLVSRKTHVPYRSSKLTHMLQDSLGGNCKTRLLACIRKDKVHALESIATLRFATRMMHVKTRPVRNVVSDSEQGVDAALIAKYEREIKALRRELAMYDSLNGKKSSAKA